MEVDVREVPADPRGGVAGGDHADRVALEMQPALQGSDELPEALGLRGGGIGVIKITDEADADARRVRPLRDGNAAGGLWADRGDLPDATEYVRSVRDDDRLERLRQSS